MTQTTKIYPKNLETHYMALIFDKNLYFTFLRIEKVHTHL